MGGGATAMSDERKIPLTEFSRRVSKYVDSAKEGPLTVTKMGQDVAVLVDIEEYRKLMELEEEAEDLYWTVVALREDVEWQRSGRPTVSLAEVEKRAHGRD